MTKRVERRNVPSPFRRLLLTDWWDGPTAGIAIDDGGDLYPFEMLDWDAAHFVRVYAFSNSPGVTWRELRADIGDSDSDDWTSWVLPVDLPTPAAATLERIEQAARLVAVAATSDLLQSILVWRPIVELPAQAPSPGWLEVLGLPRNGGP